MLDSLVVIAIKPGVLHCLTPSFAVDTERHIANRLMTPSPGLCGTKMEVPNNLPMVASIDLFGSSAEVP